MNLQEAYNFFIENRSTYCRDATVDNYKNSIRYFVQFMIASHSDQAECIDINCIKLEDINHYQIYLKNKLKNDDNPRFHTGKEQISTRTRKDYLKDLKTFFKFLDEELGVLENNPSKFIKFPKVNKRNIEPLTSSEVLMIDSCYDMNTHLGVRNLAIIHLLLDCGLRSGEVQRLKIKDIHFDDNYLTIVNGKGGKSRIVPLPYMLSVYLSLYLKYYKDTASDDIVFRTSSGKPISQNAIKCLFDRLKIKSGIIRLYPHLLRHTFGTSFILGGGSVELLRVYMGHSSIETTQQYLHIANQFGFLENIYKLDPIFRKKVY